MKKHIEAIGVVEVSFFSNAIILCDLVLKSVAVDVVSIEKRLGGRLVTLIFSGNTSDIAQAMEIVNNTGKEVINEKHIKIAVPINNPHHEIIRVLNLLK